MLLLDAAHDLAAVAEVQIGQPMSTVRLERCGSASVRLTDSAGRPIAGERATAWFWLPDDRPAGLDAHGGGPWSNAMDASWVNPRRFLPGLLTGPDGVVTLLGLVPGLQYQVKFGDWAGPAANSVPFRVLAGHAGRLPDVVVPDPPPAGHPIEKPPEAPSR
jgi:hypothetical protein